MTDSTKKDGKTGSPQPSTPALPPGPVSVTVAGQVQVKNVHEEPFYASTEFWLVLATFVPVSVTWALASYTRRLWGATVALQTDAKATSDRQATETARALKISEDAAKAARTSADATMLQVQAWIAAQMPLVAWAGAKMVEFNSAGMAIPGRDPVSGGHVPPLWKPVFTVKNLGPTHITIKAYSIQYIVTDNPPEKPDYKTEYQTSIAVPAGSDPHPFTPGSAVRLSEEDREQIKNGTKQLLIFAMIKFADFMGNMHATGDIAKWDLARGFVEVTRDNYSFST